MALKAPNALREVLARLDRELPALNDFEPGTMLRQARRAEELTEDEQKGALAEASVFDLTALPRGERSVWGTHFGPMMSQQQQDGSAIVMPDVKSLDQEIIQHWQRRAKQAVHPTLRARYADAVWDLEGIITGKSADVKYAKIAVDAYLDTVCSQKYRHEMEAVSYLERALSLSLALNDRRRIDRAKDVMFSLAQSSLEEAQNVGGWAFLFDNLYDPKNRRLALTQPEQDRIIALLEEVLNRCSTVDHPNFDPWAAQAAAERLARHYERNGRGSDVQRVIRAYGQAFESVAEKADPPLAMAWLQPLIEDYQNRGMREDAKRVQLASYEKGKNVESHLRRITVSHQISHEELERFLDALTEGPPELALERLTRHFIPDAGAIRSQLLKMKDIAPLSSMFGVVVVEGGRHAAVAGSVEQDPEGRLILQVAEHIQISSQFLSLGLQRLIERQKIDADGLCSLLFRSPVYESNRHAIILEGIRAYFAHDFVKAVHVLIPQVEHSLRRLLGLMGEPMDKLNRNGTTDIKNLNDVLREKAIGSCLGESVQLYLLTFLADRRGHNLRNRVCHGQVLAEHLTEPLTNQLLHVIMTLALVREKLVAAPEEDQN